MHVDSDLSAYLDEELVPSERERVAGHLATCDRCSARLADLRATASLISALPAPRPARSLVPHVATRWNWLRPVRSLSAVASAAFLFMFLLTSVGGGGLGGGPTSPFTPGSGNAPAAAPAPTQSPAGPLGAAAPANAPRATAGPTQAVTTATSAPAKDAASSAGAPEFGTRDTTTTQASRGEPSSPLGQPPLWLGLALLAGIGALVAHTRLRSA